LAKFLREFAYLRWKITYSPELNPDELVWNDVKSNAVGRAKLEGPKDLHRAVIGRLRSFFQAPETRYAAA